MRLLSFRVLVTMVVSLVASAVLAYQPSATSPYTFTGCSVCGTYSNHRVGDGNFHQPGCGQSGAPLYWCDCSIGYAPTEMLQPPVLRVVPGTNNVELEYWARNIYCNPPADGGNIHEPNAVSYRIEIVEIDPVTLASIATRHRMAPYWEHGKVTFTDLSPACKLYRAVYLVDTFFGATYVASSDVVGATGNSGGASCLVDLGSCPSAPGGGGVSPSVGEPINVGSGNMYYSEPLFSIAGPGGSSIDFTLSYNSRETASGALGPGFTHPFDQRLTSLGSHRLRRGADGLRALWVLENHPPTGQVRRVVYPGETTGTMTTASSPRITALDGSVTDFNTSGRWTRSADRWGNAVTGAYTGSDLTTITDALGRAVTLAYAGGRLTSITNGDGGVWRFQYDASNRLEKVFDPLHTGTTPCRQYTWIQYAAGSPAVLTKVADESGAVLEAHQYDAQGRAISSWSGDTIGSPPAPGPNARDLVTLSYDSPAQTTVTSTIDAGVAQSTVYTLRAGSGRFLATSIVGSCAACGEVADAVQYTFDDANRPLTRIAGTGTEQVETRYVYDASGMVTSMTEAFGKPEQRVTSYAYAKSNWPSFVTSVTKSSVARPGQSKVTSFSWNAAETELTQSTSGYLASTDASPTVYTTLTTFDARHRTTSQSGPVAGQQTTWSYYADADANLNRRGRLQQFTMKTTATSTLATSYDDYDVYGTARLETDPNLVETRRTLDARGRTLTVASVKPSSDANEPPDYVTTSSYDSRDRLTSVTEPLGNKTTYRYEDGTNRLLQTIRVDAGGDERERVVYALNAIGGKTTESYEECTTPAASCGSWVARRTESFTYDADGRLSTITHPDASTIVYAYDTRGNLVSVKDERHSTPNTIYAYDSRNRLESVTQKQTLDPGADVLTSYDYDAQDNLTAVTDPNGNVTTYAYDDFGRMQKQTSPVSGVTGYSYDEAGNLLTTVDANNATTTRTYDLADRLLTATSARSGQTTEVVKWGYDDGTSGSYGRGRLASMIDPAGVTTYEYDRRGLLRREARRPGTCKQAPLTCTSVRSAFVSTYGHDANGNRTSVGYPSENVVTYAFDHANRPFSAASGATTLVSSASYLPFGPLRALVFGNGTSQTFSHDARYFPLTQQVLAGATPLASYTYAHDGAGNITAIHDALDAAWNRDFDYDDLNRLTTATAGASLWGAGSYSYDAMGNLLSSTLGSSTTTFAYSSTTPKLTAVTTTGQSAVSVTYDNAGNELQAASAQTISPRNLVSSIATPALRSAYAYDGRAVRVESKLYPPPPADWTSMVRHVYSPELRPLTRFQYENYLGLPRLQHATDSIWFADRPIAQLNVTTGTLAYTAADHLGTPFLQTDATAAVVWRAEYDPYGTIHQMRTGSESAQPLRFPGQEVVGGVAERYNVFRWYRAGWGRYTQADPVHGPRVFQQTGRVISPSANMDGDQYTYTGGNPIRFIDPDGLYTRPCAVIDLKNCQSDCDKIGKRLVGCGCYGVPFCFGLLNYSVAACKDYQNGCPPCPPPPGPRIDKVPPGTPHFPCKGDHWHWTRVDQGPPPACICRYTDVLGGCL